ncbi:unnamed protein product [Lathyrus sativus]|nr:unnamed protein product [Lathyrus sativus]
MSRLDKFLISEEWLRRWPASSRWALEKGLFDHFPILLADDMKKRGPKLFQMLDCWKNIDGYHNFVREQWLNFKVEGWRCLFLKEKLNMIKNKLKEWHRWHTQNLEGMIKETKEELNIIKIKEESMKLNPVEMDPKKELTANLHKLMNLNGNIQCQRSFNRWLKEGEANTKFLHGCINKRRKVNDIVELELNGRMSKKANEIKEGIADHFRKKFEG